MGGNTLTDAYFKTFERMKLREEITFDVGGGGWVLLPDSQSGFYTSDFLRFIADKLEMMNEEVFKHANGV